MADTPAIALIVAGSGETEAAEIEDLLSDAYPEEEYEEVGLIVPVDKDLFTPAVKQVVRWYNSDKDVYPVRTKGVSLGGRAASALGSDSPQEVKRFTDILTRDEFPEEDWAEVHVLLAMPTDEDDPDYDLYADVADLAQQAGFKVKNLCAGLDDIVVIEPEDASKDEEPEPEPEEPKTRRRRGRAADKDEEPEEPAEEEKPEPKRRSRAKTAESIEEVQEAVSTAVEPAEVEETKSDLLLRVEGLEQQVADLQQILRNVGSALGASTINVSVNTPPAAPEKPAEDEDAPKRGRGRPRTDFDVRQIWSEDEDDWIPRPKGRLRKGTDWRTIHAETGEVLEEGTA